MISYMVKSLGFFSIYNAIKNLFYAMHVYDDKYFIKYLANINNKINEGVHY